MLVRLAAEAGSKEELVLQEKGTDLILNLLLDREANQQKLSLRRSMQCRPSYLLSELPYKIGELMEDAKIIVSNQALLFGMFEAKQPKHHYNGRTYIPVG